MADALCKEYPVEWFFAERRPGVDAGGLVQQAKGVCRRCLVVDECRTFALTLGDDLQGVWGATTRMERRAMRRTVAA